jgi:hypothetical protein
VKTAPGRFAVWFDSLFGGDVDLAGHYDLSTRSQEPKVIPIDEGLRSWSLVISQRLPDL